MGKVFEFSVETEPVGKGRPRFSNRGGFTRTYTPKKTADYEKMIANEYKRQGGFLFPDLPLSVRVDAVMQIPKSASKKASCLMENGTTRPTKKPDCDNLLKAILDALNGIAYSDDKYIVNAQITKRYGKVGAVNIKIKEVV